MHSGHFAFVDSGCDRHRATLPHRGVRPPQKEDECRVAAASQLSLACLRRGLANPFTQGDSPGASEKSGILWSWERPLGTPLGLVKWKG